MATDTTPSLKEVEKKARASFMRQRDYTDCGVACLCAIISYHGGLPEREHLRNRSGTSTQGTTLLGLYQAAEEEGLEAGAYEANLEELKEVDQPCILHVLKDEHLRHYFVCYGFVDGVFLISDPAEGVKRYTPEELEAVWQSQALLLLAPTDDLVMAETRKQDKWDWFRRLIREDYKILLGAAGLGLLIALLSLSIALFSQVLIDEILPGSSQTQLVIGLGLLALALLVKSGLTYARKRLLIRQTRDFNNRVVGRFYGALLNLPQPFFFGRRTGDLVARLNDTRRLQQAVTYLVGNVMIDALTFLVAFAFILNYAVSLGLIALLSLPLYALLAYLYHRPIVQEHRRVMSTYGASESNYVDTIQGMSTIKTTGQESRFAERTEKIFGRFQEERYTFGRLSAGFTFWGGALGAFLQVGVLAWSAFLLLQGQLGLGALVAILMMTGLLVPAAMRLALTNLKLQEARVAFDRMYELTSLRPEFSSDSEEGKECPTTLETLEVNDLDFRFRGRPILLQDVSFSLRRGEIVTLMGETGCGKTTVLYLLQRFYRPEQGSLIVNGTTHWDELSTPAWRDLLGVVSQQVKLFNATLIENICLDDPQEHAEDVMDFCKEYGFHKYFDEFPQSYLTILGEQGVNISGGQQQLVALARALYQQPQLLLLDEATSAMDRETETDMLQLLTRLKEEMAILLVTHRPQSARYADRIYVIDEEGHTQTEGSPAALAARDDNLFARTLTDLTLLESTSVA